MNFKKIGIILIIILVIIIGVFSYISINTHNTKIEVVSNSTLKNGDEIKLVLKDSYGNVYPNQEISIKLLDDSGHSNKYVLSTNNDGEVSVKLEALKPDNYTVHCEFNGTLFLTSSKTISDLQIIHKY